MKITLNGEEKKVLAQSVAALIDELELPVGKVAVELNLEIVPKSAYLATALNPGDRIEIVHFVGGG
jgi:thiamine biosynthesis protein ThiS